MRIHPQWKGPCRDCLLYEQDKWEIVSAKPGNRVKIILEKPSTTPYPHTLPRADGHAHPSGHHDGHESAAGKKLFHLLGVDPDNPPPDPFSSANPASERIMSDDSCKNCEAYRLGKKSAKFLGECGSRSEK